MYRAFKMSIYFLFLSLSVTILQGCTQDSDNSASPTSAYSLEQKAEILKLAEKYGLNFTFTDVNERDGKIGKIFTIEEIENEFKQISNALSQSYAMVGTNEGVAVSSIPKSLKRLKNPSESGSFAQDKYNFATGFKLSVTVSWDIITSSIANTTVKSECIFINSPNPYTYYEQTESTATLTPNSDLITFSGKGKYYLESTGSANIEFSGSLWADDIPIHGVLNF